jgi:hypothetical protein
MSEEDVVLVRASHFVCAQCGAPGSPDPGYTQIDPRYATGLCSGDHKGPQHLVKEGVLHTPKKKRGKKHA